jgi:hypothetical protein
MPQQHLLPRYVRGKKNLFFLPSFAQPATPTFIVNHYRVSSCIIAHTINLFVGIFMALIYFRGLAWEYSAETVSPPLHHTQTPVECHHPAYGSGNGG